MRSLRIIFNIVGFVVKNNVTSSHESSPDFFRFTKISNITFGRALFLLKTCMWTIAAGTINDCIFKILFNILLTEKKRYIL